MIEIIGEPGFGRTDAHVGVRASGVVDGELYARLAPELMRFAVSLVGPSDAEDLLGSAVIKAISARRWPSVENKRAYLYRTLVNEARSSHRSRARRQGRELRVYHRDDFEPDVVDPMVMRSLRMLSVRQRAVVHLTYWADLAPGQVAEMLDTSLRTVERDLSTARTRLKELLS